MAQLTSLNFKGFNYVSYYNGGYANAELDAGDGEHRRECGCSRF